MSSSELALTKPLGLFGNPVEHSFSPLFMNHALKLLELNYRYLAFAVEEDGLHHAVQALRTLHFRGANVTIPFKQSVTAHLDHVDTLAEKIGAVNCIVNDEGVLTGYNTDQAGFVKPLTDRGIGIKGKRALVAGAGGAARAVLAGLAAHGIAQVVLLNRTERNAASLIEWCTKKLQFASITYGGRPRDLEQQLLSSCDLVVNTTPVGMHPNHDCSPLPDTLCFAEHQCVYDLIYNPLQTSLLGKAAQEGAAALNGFEMLIIQGLYSLAYWFPRYAERIFALQEKIMNHTVQTANGE
jgi:shikimate dehydrogenase